MESPSEIVQSKAKLHNDDPDNIDNCKVWLLMIKWVSSNARSGFLGLQLYGKNIDISSPYNSCPVNMEAEELFSFAVMHYLNRYRRWYLHFGPSHQINYS